MTKTKYTPPTPNVQATINNPDFKFETEFCYRINKIRAIADLFFCAGTGDAHISSEGLFGVHYILEDCVEDLRKICYKMLEGVDNDNEI
ncbi:MAG: hypothetical protein KKF12_12300 [Proteobacteria bacterium]|nr:hypothetical protein [Desulfobacula sp.]MBU3951026.1 hypothetical protein [Pseudomonadota bacterium]MBU4009511.1 hypothetical protein [Pseudomonadota bacterium]MBU4131594.1 hypothetical protein [Pseudomonadota bacterium]